MTDTYVITGVAPLTKAIIVKDPDAVLDYVFDWTAYLADIADSIASAQVIVDSGITLNSSNVSAGTKVIAWISGGTAGTTYKVTCRIVTAANPARTDDRSIFLMIVDR